MSDNTAPTPAQVKTRTLDDIERGKIQIDDNIKSLVDVLNSLDGILTTESCGGHRHPGPGQRPGDEWGIFFVIEDSQAGVESLTFLAWAINFEARGDMGGMGTPVRLYPYVSHPDNMLIYALEGWRLEACDPTPEEMAEYINYCKNKANGREGRRVLIGPMKSDCTW